MTPTELAERVELYGLYWSNGYLINESDKALILAALRAAVPATQPNPYEFEDVSAPTTGSAIATRPADGGIFAAQLIEDAAKLVQPHQQCPPGSVVSQEMVDLFLRWPLPSSVCCDDCATQQGYPNRIGTNLLTAVEARNMLEWVLSATMLPEQDGQSDQAVESAKPASGSALDTRVAQAHGLTEQEIHDALDVAECAVHDKEQNPNEREWVHKILQRIRRLALSAISMPPRPEPVAWQAKNPAVGCEWFNISKEAFNIRWNGGYAYRALYAISPRPEDSELSPAQQNGVDAERARDK